MSAPSPALPPPPPCLGGSTAAEIAIFSGVLVAFVCYHVFYFARHRLHFHHDGRGPTLDLWTTAVESRVVWAEQIMKDKGEALLGVQTLRNIVVASTLIVMGMAQVLGRLLDIFVTASSIQQLRRYTCSDPIAPNSFASPQLKVGLSILVLLLSLGTFAQACRLAVHLSFMLRVAPDMHEHKAGLALPLREELIALTHRVSLYFTMGIRSLYLFFMLLTWCVGITTFLAFSAVVLILLVFSDFVPTGPPLDTQPTDNGYDAEDRQLPRKPRSLLDRISASGAH